jgi:hypothetical protein
MKKLQLNASLDKFKDLCGAHIADARALASYLRNVDAIRITNAIVVYEVQGSTKDTAEWVVLATIGEQNDQSK